MPERMHRTQILLPEQDYRRLKRTAKKEHRSLGAIVRDAVVRYHQDADRHAEYRRRLLALRGAFPNVSMEDIRDETDREL